MKPNFALDLSHDGIGLLHRGKGGWTLVGDVALDDPNMGQALDLLRQEAQLLDTNGVTTKLVIPDSQLLFTTMTAPGPDDVTREARIREGLEGLTPYPVEDLVFDWQVDPQDPAMAHVAVVARETLDEAEAFASEYEMNPISFVARPSGSFSGEAYFGPTSASQSILGGKKLERDKRALPVLTNIPPSQDQVIETQVQDNPPAIAPEPPAAPDLAPFPPTPDEAPAARAPSKPKAAKPKAEAMDGPASTPIPRPDLATDQTPLPDEPPIPAFSTRRDGEARGDAELTSPEPVVAQTQSRLSFTNGADSLPGDVGSAPPPQPARAIDPADFDVPQTDTALVARRPDEPAAPAQPKGQRREKLTSAARKGLAGVATAAGAASAAGKAAANKLPKRKRAELSDVPDGESKRPRFPRLKRTPSEESESETHIAPPPHLTGGATGPRSPRAREEDALTIFGARQAQQVGGKPKYLGLFLVLGLLLLMAIVAIWSMFFLDTPTAWLFPEQQEDPFEIAIADPTPDLSDPALQNPDTFTDPALIETDEPGEQEPLSPEAAKARYAATGIWQRAPEPLKDPVGGRLNDLYVASLDPKVTAHDAVALPSTDIATLGLGTLSVSPPPPLGTTFALDDNGLVRATPEGALTPEGVMVFAGKPPLVPAPAPRPDVAVDVETATVEPQAPRIRPKARPEGLVEGNERLLLGGRTRTELAALRPRARPSSPQAEAQAAAIAAAVANAGVAAEQAAAAAIAPTKLAIAQSIEPRHRPRDFSKIVARTNTREDASDGSVAVAAAAVPRTQSVAPKIPTTASVAKQATIRNAINLRKVSLIGIYGSSSSRRALVRLASGRYVKVGVGSRLDGGKVVSISSTKLVYKKGSRTTTLEVLPFS